MNNSAVSHELILIDGKGLICLETGERDYQISAKIGDIPGLLPAVTIARGRTPTEAMVTAIKSGAFDRLEFETASDTLTLHVCRRVN